MVFVDTGAWYARHVTSDPNHARVKAWFDANDEPLLTTDYCLDETLTLLVGRNQLQVARILGRALLDERFAEFQFVTPEQVHKAWILFEKRASAGWSFTDCTSRVVMNDFGVRTAVALDDHFRQFEGAVVVP